MEAEKYYIKAAKGFSEGYNANGGGDGSRPIRPQVSNLVASMSTPELGGFITRAREAQGEKSYSLVGEDGRMQLDATPGAYRTLPTAYEVELQNSDESDAEDLGPVSLDADSDPPSSGSSQVYAGSTTDSVWNRFQGHASSRSSAVNRAVRKRRKGRGRVKVLYRHGDPAHVRLFETVRIWFNGEESLNRTGGVLSAPRSVEESPNQSARRLRRVYQSVEKSSNPRAPRRRRVYESV